MNSQIIIDFQSVPLENEVLNINESLHAINLNEIFKAARAASYQTEIPLGYTNEYNQWVYSGYISEFYKN